MSNPKPIFSMAKVTEDGNQVSVREVCGRIVIEGSMLEDDGGVTSRALMLSADAAKKILCCLNYWNKQTTQKEE